MQFRTALFFTFIFCLLEGYAQQTPLEIKYKAWDLHALRYYPFAQPADSFIQQVIDRQFFSLEETTANRYEKTAVDMVINKQYLADEINRSTASQNLIFKHVLLPYGAWLNYARPVREDSPNLNLPLFLSERSLKENQRKQSSVQSPLNRIEPENIGLGLEEWLGDVNILKEKNEVLYFSVKSPMAKDAGKTYRYFFSSQTETEGIPVYEIAFFSQKLNAKAFEGYLYVSVNDLSFVKAIFTLNFMIKKRPVNSVLFIQTPSKKETLLSIGNEITTGLMVEQVRILKSGQPDSIFSDYLSPAQKEISGLVEEARRTHAFSNLQNGLSFLLTDHIGIFRNTFNLGAVTQMLSYNYMEGVRLRVGGFTSHKVNRQASIGGYLAYGSKDKQWKYRGDIVFSPRLTNRFRFTYINDLNIPGQDCLEDKRDRIFYSLYQTRTTNMSLQKIGQLSFETDGLRPFSLKLNTKYLYDQPIGIVKYETANNGIHSTINDITTAEIGVSLRYSPNERYLRIKNKRIILHSPDVDFRLNHRVGIKGLLGSDYYYHITDARLSKSFELPMNTGLFGIRFSGGKVWNQAPFPLLFIPAGNQSYVYEANDYNLMRFYEFVTDQFIAGNADLKFNWSPLNLFFPKSSLKTHGGIKTIYGPLSDKNNPQLHPELFIFNNGIEGIGEKPYTEVNIGLSGILKYLRIDYVYRLTYGNKGSLFVSTAFKL